MSASSSNLPLGSLSLDIIQFFLNKLKTPQEFSRAVLSFTTTYCLFQDMVMLVYRLVLFVLQYLIPLIVITGAYARMAHTLWGNKTPGNAQDSRDATLMKNKQRVSSISLSID